jgi:hypothetical protein
MNLTNDSYVILIGTKSFTERYYRDKTGWLKVSARGRTFRLTAEQVLNHLLPALAGIKPNLTIKVNHRDPPVPKKGSVNRRAEADGGAARLRGTGDPQPAAPADRR